MFAIAAGLLGNRRDLFRRRDRFRLISRSGSAHPWTRCRAGASRLPSPLYTRFDRFEFPQHDTIFIVLEHLEFDETI